MGEEKVKAEGQRGPSRYYRPAGAGRGGYHPRKQSEKFKAPTAGLEDQIFTCGSAKDAAAYDEVRKKLSYWASVNFKGAGAAQAQAAIEQLVEPTLVEPTEANDADGIVAIEKWKVAFNKYNKEKDAWEEVKGKAYHLVLSHCHPEVRARLEGLADWPTTSQDKNVIALLRGIRAIAHQNDDTKPGAMQYVEQNLNLELGFQTKKDQSLADFYKIFKARVEVIDALGGKAGFHHVLYNNHLQKICTRDGNTVATRTPAQRDEAIKTSCEEYKACLFIRIS
jgi:hypothetical protein